MKIFFIGIGGISMSALAVICKNVGYDVYGSDRESSEITKKLEKSGIKIYIGHNKDNITEDFDMVVYTAAIAKDNEELVKSYNLGLNTMERANFLGHLMEKYENSIAISGTHGKTTTTSMLTLIFNKANTSPTALIGGVFANIGGNIEIGSSDIFITEACEYVDSFLQFFPKIAIITNIEADHLDYFKDLESIKKSFLKFSNQVKSNGFVIANGDDENVKSALKNSNSKIYYCGFDETNDFVCKNVKSDDEGYPNFDLFFKNELIENFSLKVYGKHNIYNAICSIAAAYLCKINSSVIKSALLEFTGVGRRFEYIGEKNGVKVYDDYAHHPTEIKATLNAAKSIKKNRLISIFQPHTYSRTKSLFKDFNTCFDDTDIIIFADIYPAREPFDPTISSKMLCEEVKNRGIEAYHFDSFEKITDFLQKTAKENDIIFTIGAGDVYKIGKLYLN